jgi:4-hydroxybutyryl-CoA dehydratase / vinylacetyl-CoA-Delta-isomerase
MMKTGEQYKESLKDGRATYLDGKRVSDPATEPRLQVSVDVAADVYDSFYSADPGASNPIYVMPRSIPEFNERRQMLAKGKSDMTLGTTGVILLTLATAAPELAKLNPGYRECIYEYIDYVRRNDLRCAESITDAKGHRKLRPNKQSDPDFYVHVVDRTSDGVYISGCKMHISGASIGHEQVVLPTKAMRPGEEEYAIACAVPVNAPGVKVIDTTYAPYGDQDLRNFPVSGRRSAPEGFVIFDNVFVPKERIFLDGEVQQAAVLAHSLGLWERAAGVAEGGAGLDRDVGMAALLAEANGIENEPHIRDSLATLVIHSTMCRAAGEAAMANGQQNEDGIVSPSQLYISALKYYKNEFHAKLLDILHDIAGTLTVTAPTFADLENPDLHDGLDTMLATPTLTAEQRLRLFHYLRDTTADAYGGWSYATGQLAGGGQYAQRLVTMRHFDMQHAKNLARRVLEPGSHDDEQGAVAPV